MQIRFLSILKLREIKLIGGGGSAIWLSYFSIMNLIVYKKEYSFLVMPYSGDSNIFVNFCSLLKYYPSMLQLNILIL